MSSSATGAKLRLAVNGAAGRMGRAVIRAAALAEDVQLVGAVERPGHQQLGTDAGELAAVARLGVPLCADLEQTLARAEVLVDFSTPDAAVAAVELAAARGVPVVSGATGLGAAALDSVRAAAGRIPVVLAPNMSVGMNLLFALAAQAARVLGPAFDLSIHEIHHRAKRDAPSGTALRLQETLHQASQREVPVVALRGGDVVGDHTVHLLGPGERLELVHRATDRAAFAVGALRAARWICGRPPRLYDMQDVLGLS